VSFASSSEFLPSRPARRPQPTGAFHGVPRPPSRHQQPESTLRRASQGPPTFRPQRFSRSRRLAPPLASRACFIPLPRLRFHSSGVCSRQAADPTRRRLLPSRRCLPSPAARRSDRRRLRDARPQGFDPPVGPLCPACRLERADHPGPLSSFNSLRFSSAHLESAANAPSAPDLAGAPSLWCRRPAFNVSIGARPSLLSPEGLPVRASRPSSACAGEARLPKRSTRTAD
jgi:hypothetical protein